MLDKLKCKWSRGEATSQLDLADPTTTTAYRLCIYAGSGDELIAGVAIPPDATKWRELGTAGYKYKDHLASAGGITRALLKGGAAGRAKALLKGKGSSLPNPPLLLSLPVTIQLTNSSTDVCLGAEYDGAAVIRNDATQFKARIR